MGLVSLHHPRFRLSVALLVVPVVPVVAVPVVELVVVDMETSQSRLREL